MNETPGRINTELSRRRVLEILGIGTAGVAGVGGLTSCARGGEGGSGGGGKDGKETEFHGIWPYPKGGEGHFNMFTGVLNSILTADGEIYGDLIRAPGGMYLWNEKKWEWLLCEKVELSETEATYHLKSGLKWSNGDPITAKDVETTFWCRYLMAQLEFAAGYIKDIKTQGENTVVFSLNNPASVLERYLIKAPIFADKTYGKFAAKGKAAFKAAGGKAEGKQYEAAAAELRDWRPTKGKEEEEVLTSGPYRIDFKSVSDVKVTLKKNKNGIRSDKVAFDKLVVFNGETEEATPLLQEKSADYATHGFPLGTIKSLESQGFRIIRPAVYSGPGLMPNYKKVPEFGDPRVRQALAHLIDRKSIAATSLGPSAKAVQYFAGFSDILVAEWLSAEEQASLEKYPHDEDKAAKLLEAAGFKRSGGKWQKPNGKPAAYTLAFPSDFADWAPAGRAWAQQASKFGIAITQQGIKSDQLNPAIDKGDFELAIQAWGAGHPHPSFGFRDSLMTNNYPVTRSQGGDGMGFNLKVTTKVAGKVDLIKLVAESGQGLEEAEQKPAVAKLAKIYNELLPIVPIFERYGNNPCLEGERVAKWPSDDDAIIKYNSPYGDNPTVLLMYQGVLKPA